MDLEALNVKMSYPLIVGGMVVALIAAIWCLVRVVSRRDLSLGQRVKWPLIVVFIGLAAAAAPPIIGKLIPIDLGPRDKMVNGERHLTLTGWDQSDYSFLPQKSDAALLQMANADVSDGTLEYLRGFTKLTVLDVSNSKVTDAGLAVIARLSTLETLYLNNTAVTDAGVRTLADHPTLKVIWLRGTTVTKDAADAVKSAKPGRRVIIDAPKQ